MPRSIFQSSFSPRNIQSVIKFSPSSKTHTCVTDDDPELNPTGIDMINIFTPCLRQREKRPLRRSFSIMMFILLSRQRIIEGETVSLRDDGETGS
ncbi:hypothetical protein CEXT_687771 [Caerostris extrusa]|uniref:Uncharacterized protein n=1 Tax=Caerostris extrusa TaxID=172846 RepID=A0AAV4QSZ6_CAEEX|nr:hypothetical protein CEXT_687771 [Caerostris extrusa]